MADGEDAGWSMCGGGPRAQTRRKKPASRLARARQAGKARSRAEGDEGAELLTERAQHFAFRRFQARLATGEQAELGVNPFPRVGQHAVRQSYSSACSALGALKLYKHRL